MSRLDWARIRDQCLVAVCLLFFVYAIFWFISRYLIHAAVLVMLAVVVASALEPVLIRLEKYVPRMGAALLTYAFAIVVFAVGTYLMLGPLIGQSNGLGGRLPGYFDHLVTGLNRYAAQYGVVLPPPSEARNNLVHSVQGQLQSIVFQVIGYIQLVLGIVADTALILLLAFWLLVDGARIRAASAGLVPEQHRTRVRFVEDTLSTVLGGYIRGQLTMAAIIGISSGLGCWALGVQYPVVIGALAFLFELVPMVGPILAALPAVMISFFQPFPLVLYVVLFFTVMQFVENNILAPRITGSAVGLHPVAAIIGLVGGFEIGGIVGALFALPTLSALSILASAALKAWRGEPVVVQRRGMTFRMPGRRRTKPAA